METITKVQRQSTSITAETNGITVYIDYETIDGATPVQIVAKSNFQQYDQVQNGEQPFGYLTVVMDEKGNKNIQINDVKDLDLTLSLVSEIKQEMDAIVQEFAPAADPA